MSQPVTELDHLLKHASYSYGRDGADYKIDIGIPCLNVANEITPHHLRIYHELQQRFAAAGLNTAAGIPGRTIEDPVKADVTRESNTVFFTLYAPGNSPQQIRETMARIFNTTPAAIPENNAPDVRDNLRQPDHCGLVAGLSTIPNRKPDTRERG